MTVKVYLLAFLAAFLIIHATAELPTEGKDALDSDAELDFVKSALQLDQNMAEVKGIRQKREAIADPKKGNRKHGKKKGNKGRKGKGNNNGKQNPNNKENKTSKNDQKKGKRKGNNKIRQKQKKKGSGKNNKPKKSVKNKGDNGGKGGRRKSKPGNNRRTEKFPKKGGNGQNSKKGTKSKNEKNGRTGENSKNPRKGKKGGNGQNIKKGTKSKNEKNGRTGKKSKNPRKGKKGKPKNMKKKKKKGKKEIPGEKFKNPKKIRIEKTKKKDEKTNNEKDSEKNTKSKNGKNGRNGKKSKNPRKGKNGKPKDMDKKKKKGKKSEIKKKPNKGSRARPRQSNATVSLTCLRDAVTFTKFLKDNVVNFLRQYSRLTRQIKLTNNKAGKKGEFKIPAARLIQAGGGDRTNLSCGGSTTSVGAKKLFEIANNLDGCAAGIKNACKPPEINKTELEECKTNAVAYNTTVSTCITKATKGEDACSCFQADAVAKEKKVLTKCKAQSKAKSSAKARKECLNTLSYCKNNATEAGVLQYACQFSTEELTKTLKQLTTNEDAFKKFLAKIKSLTGLSGAVPGTTSNRTSRSRAVRNAEEEDEEEDVFDSPQARVRGKRQEVACSTVVTSITTCTTSITNTPALIIVETKCKAVTYTIAECSDTDKTDIQTALNNALEKNAIILAFMDAIKAELKATTGSTPSPSDGTAGTNRVAARSRSLLRKMIMEKMQLRN